MSNVFEPNLPELIRGCLPSPNSARHDRARLAPRLSYGRHQGPCSPDAKPAAVLLLLFRRDDQWHLPLTVRQAHLPAHAGQVSLPGGMLESGESTCAGALRESEEEIGIPASQVQLLGRLTDLNLYNSNYYVVPWVGYVAEQPAFQPNPEEVAELFELPLSALDDANNIDQMEIRHGRLRFSAPCIRWHNHRIWGATSMIIAEFAGILKNASQAPSV